jgi:phosphoribosylglycinamide formyltransferase-1
VSKKRIAVLVSGNGSNLQALIDACKAADFPAEIVLVISNKPDAYGLKRAQKANIATELLLHADYANREAFDAALHETLVAHQIELVCLAGFMRILTPGLVEKWQGRMLNIHPSLLPSFKGMHTHQQALATGVKIHGCTVHHVVAEMDSGPIIIQAALVVHAYDTPESLKERVLKAEHMIYPIALKKILDPKSEVSDATPDETVLIQY